MSESTYLDKPESTEPDDDSKNIDVLIKCLPLFTGYAIGIGILKALLFYSIFKIDIMEFISLGEAIMMSISFIVIIAGLIGIEILIIDFLRIKSRIKKSVGRRASFDTRIHRLKLALTVLAGLSVIALIVEAIVKNTIYYWLCAGIWFLTALFSVITTEYLVLKLKNNDGKNLFFEITILMLGVIAFMELSLSLMTALNIRYEKPDLHVVVNMKDNKAITTSDTFVYVGKVENFILLYNKRFQAPEIIPTIQITDIKWIDTSEAMMKK